MAPPSTPPGTLLVVSAHAGDFVWRAGGAIALATARGDRAVVLCLTYGERGESARAWRAGRSLPEIKAQRRDEAERAAVTLGAEIEFLDAGDYPLPETDELVDRIVRVYRAVEPTVVLTHPLVDPYNMDHPAAARIALRARILAQAIGYDAPGEPLGAPPVFFFEPHQPEQCEFVPQVLLDVTGGICSLLFRHNPRAGVNYAIAAGCLWSMCSGSKCHGAFPASGLRPSSPRTAL